MPLYQLISPKQKWRLKTVFFFPIYYIYLLYLLICSAWGAHACVYMPWSMYVWKSEESLWELVLSFHHVGPRDGTHVIRLNNKFLYLLSHLSSPRVAFLILNCLAIPGTEEATRRTGIHVYVCTNLLKVEFRMFLLFLIWLSQSSWLIVSHLNLCGPPAFHIKGKR